MTLSRLPEESLRGQVLTSSWTALELLNEFFSFSICSGVKIKIGMTTSLLENSINFRTTTIPSVERVDSVENITHTIRCTLIRAYYKEVLPGFTCCCQSNIINDTKVSSENENASLGYSHFCKFLWILFLLAHFFISSPICYVTKLKMSSSVLRNRPRVLQRRKKSSEEHRSIIRKIREVGKNES